MDGGDDTTRSFHNLGVIGLVRHLGIDGKLREKWHLGFS